MAVPRREIYSNDSDGDSESDGDGCLSDSCGNDVSGQSARHGKGRSGTSDTTVENIPTEIHSSKFTEIKSIYVAFQVGTHFQ